MTKSNQNLVKVDIFNVSRHQQTLTGTIAVAKMPELCKFLVNEEGEFEVTIQGTKGAKGLPGAVLTITGTVEVPCTHCNKPITVEIDREVPFLFVKSEAEANRMPLDEDEDMEIVVGSDQMNVAEWVQEEVILSLPTFPKHDDCEMPEVESDEEEIVEPTRPNPFANLKDLMKKN